MKLIVDAQLPAKLCEVLNQLGLESIHFRNNTLIIKNALNRSSFVELSNEGITEYK